MDLLQAINSELLVRNSISEQTAEVLKGIMVPQWHSRGIAETLLDYPSLREALIEEAKKKKISEVSVSLKSATGRTKPFWDFSQDSVAVLVINEH